MEPQDKSLTDYLTISRLYQFGYVMKNITDGALRCFAPLADRFSRRGNDPAPLACNRLFSELLYR